MKKNLTLFVLFAFAFSFFGMKADAQTLTVNWVDRIGPYNVTVRVTTSGVPAGGAILRTYWGDYGFPPWWAFYVDYQIPAGSNSQNLAFNTQNMGINTGQYFDARYVFLDQSYNEIGTPGTGPLFQNGASFPPMYVVVSDVVGGFPPGITLSAGMPNGQYGAGRSYLEYQTVLRNDIWDTAGTYSNYRTFTQPIQTSISASYNLPPGGGYFCFVWSATDSDISLDSHFTNVEVFRSDTLCFYWQGISTELEELASQDGELKTFPNPFVDVLNVVSPEAEKFSLVDLSGRTVSTGRLNQGVNSLFTPGLSAGTYILLTDSGLRRQVVKQ